jgi:hypothetical protein
MEFPTRRRRALSTALAVFLALESVTVVAAAARASISPQGAHALPDAPPAGIILSESIADEPRTGAPANLAAVTNASGSTAEDMPATPASRIVVPAGEGVSTPAAALPTRATLPDRAPRATRSSPASSGAARADAAAYSGRNRVWIPALRISRSVSPFPCDRARPPGNRVYRWGCAGANNIYLMGHAYSVFKPLHDAYAAGRLAVGMKAWYADSKGRVHVYVVKWWKTVRPTTGAKWAWAAQDKPSMTLQTCVGTRGQYRLMVRLVEVDG